MKVHFTGDTFARQRYGGISSYFVNLIQELMRDESYGIDPVGLPFGAKSEALIAAHLSRRMPGRILSARAVLNSINGVATARARRSARVVHGTYYSSKHLRADRNQATATTIHDMTPEIFPEHFPMGNPHLFKRNHAYEADVIFCVSETTRTDLLTIYPSLKAEVVVTPLATGAPFTSTPPATGTLGGSVDYPYVLFVGGRARYKAFSLLSNALSRVRDAGYDIGLVAVGGGQFQNHERQELADLGVPESRVTWLTPSDNELAHLYRGAELLSYPSEYEGFGLPLLDALASGCIAVTSDAPALLEVGGGVTLTHPRGDAVALATTIQAVIDLAANDAATLRADGRSRAATFSWQRTALATASGYRRLG